MSDNPNTPKCPDNGRADAIRNMSGKVWLYEKHLSNFKTTYASAAIELSDLMESCRFDEARILIHSIKGLSGTLGLHKLYYTATILEKSIIDSSPLFEDYLALFNLYMQELLSDSEKD